MSNGPTKVLSVTSYESIITGYKKQQVSVVVQFWTWFKFISLRLKLIIIYYDTQKPKKRKVKPRINWTTTYTAVHMNKEQRGILVVSYMITSKHVRLYQNIVAMALLLLFLK